jgi:hypothetical protein
MIQPMPAGQVRGWGTQDLKEAHAWLSPIDLRFRELASCDPRFLERSTFGILDQENPLLSIDHGPNPGPFGTFVQQLIADFADPD